MPNYHTPPLCARPHLFEESLQGLLRRTLFQAQEDRQHRSGAAASAVRCVEDAGEEPLEASALRCVTEPTEQGGTSR